MAQRIPGTRRKSNTAFYVGDWVVGRVTSNDEEVAFGGATYRVRGLGKTPGNYDVEVHYSDGTTEVLSNQSFRGWKELCVREETVATVARTVLTPDQLRVGDVVVGDAMPTALGGKQNLWSNKWLIRAILGVRSSSGSFYVMMEKVGDSQPAKEWPYSSTVMLVVDRQLGGSHQPAVPSGRKHIDPYPGRCPLCAQPAYVSMLAVAHKDESQAAACTARRV